MAIHGRTWPWKDVAWEGRGLGRTPCDDAWTNKKKSGQDEPARGAEARGGLCRFAAGTHSLRPGSGQGVDRLSSPVPTYNRGTIPTMLAKLMSGQSVDEVIAWAADEPDGFTR